MGLSRVFAARSAAVAARFSSGGVYKQMVVKQIVPLGLLLALTPFLFDTLSALDFGAALERMQMLPVSSWGLALVMTMVSYLAIGRYDGVVHRVLRTGQSGAEPRLAGMVSIALSQTTGFGIAVGTLARWRMLPGCSMTQCFAVTATVSLLFLGGWAFITGVSLVLLPHKAEVPLALAWGGIALGLMVCLASILRPFGLRVPSLKVLGALTLWIAIDLLTASAAFWLVLPPETALYFAQLLPVFLIAFTFGLLSGAPAGIGPFEVAALALLPHIPAQELLCGLIAFRVIYFVVPALLAVAALAVGPRSKPQSAPQGLAPATIPTDQRYAIARSDGRAERGLVHLGQLELVTDRHLRPLWLVRPSGQSLIALQDPLNAHAPAQNWTALLQTAQTAGLSALAYKCSARFAQAARRSGAHVMALCQEAVIPLAGYTLDSPQRRQLRRKLRNAEKAGVTVFEANAATQMQTLRALDAEWQDAHGRAKGFSMGRFCPEYLMHQRVFIALHKGVPVAFVSFHATAQEWTLDLMRHANAPLPDGTMHSLVQRAVELATRAKATQMSLAAVPLPQTALLARLPATLRRPLDAALAADGLRQFKSSFAPCWVTRYAAAQTKAALVSGLWDCYREIHKPAPLPSDAALAPLQTRLTKIMSTMHLLPRHKGGI